jgi:hypothetical protein
MQGSAMGQIGQHVDMLGYVLASDLGIAYALSPDTRNVMLSTQRCGVVRVVIEINNQSMTDSQARILPPPLPKRESLFPHAAMGCRFPIRPATLTHASLSNPPVNSSIHSSQDVDAK